MGPLPTQDWYLLKGERVLLMRAGLPWVLLTVAESAHGRGQCGLYAVSVHSTMGWLSQVSCVCTCSYLVSRVRDFPIDTSPLDLGEEKPCFVSLVQATCSERALVFYLASEPESPGGSKGVVGFVHLHPLQALTQTLHR